MLIPSKNEVIKNRDFGKINGSLTRNQRVAFAVFIKTAYLQMIEGKNQKKFKIPTKKLCQDMGIEHRNIFGGSSIDGENASLEKALTSLMGKILEWRYKDEDGEDTVEKCSMLSGFKMNRQTTEFEFSSWLKDRILCHGNAYILQMPVLAGLRSGYAVALFEQIEQRRDFFKWKVSVENFRNIMGIKQDEYKVFKDVRERVIKPAIEEIIRKTDYFVWFEQIKTGRTITDLIFRWEHKPDVKNGKTKVDPIQKELDRLKGIVIKVQDTYFRYLGYELESNGYFSILVENLEDQKARIKTQISSMPSLLKQIQEIQA